MNIPIGQWSGSDATNALRETITEFNQRATGQTEMIIRLTKMMLWLTVAVLMATLAQVVVALVAIVTKP